MSSPVRGHDLVVRHCMQVPVQQRVEALQPVFRYSRLVLCVHALCGCSPESSKELAACVCIHGCVHTFASARE